MISHVNLGAAIPRGVPTRNLGHRRPLSPQLGIVEHIIVHQRRHVHHLDDGAKAVGGGWSFSDASLPFADQASVDQVSVAGHRTLSLPNNGVFQNFQGNAVPLDGTPLVLEEIQLAPPPPPPEPRSAVPQLDEPPPPPPV